MRLPGPENGEKKTARKAVKLSAGGPTEVYQQGQVIVKDAGPWTPTVHSLLRHLERQGFTGSPRLVGDGFDASGRQTLTYIEGEFADPGPWALEGAAGVGQLLRELHNATASFRPPAEAAWQPWFGRPLGGPSRVIGHCDVAPWNIVARDGMPVALIDWEFAGPVDPVVELAQACWLNAKLHDDDVAERDGLPSFKERAEQARAIVEAYGLPATDRRCFVDRIIEFVICDTAEQADEAGVTPETTDLRSDELGFNPLWALAWRARAAAWLVHHRRALQNALS
ncbi:MAG TPA: aminoglycoside phosphotransferase family protein [Armatimonadota bacterium]|nr:aminoglycoside phosphotransferase family protein [Armatimonadota bacterium]